MKSLSLLVLAFFALLAGVRSRPQEAPMPYNFQWDVNDEASGNFYGHEETGNENGLSTGEYRVLLPNGKLMKVSYTVEGDSGFKPIITYEDNYTPQGWGKR